MNRFSNRTSKQVSKWRAAAASLHELEMFSIGINPQALRGKELISQPLPTPLGNGLSGVCPPLDLKSKKDLNVAGLKWRLWLRALSLA